MRGKHTNIHTTALSMYEFGDHSVLARVHNVHCARRRIRTARWGLPMDSEMWCPPSMRGCSPLQRGSGSPRTICSSRTCVSQCRSPRSLNLWCVVRDGPAIIEDKASPSASGSAACALRSMRCSVRHVVVALFLILFIAVVFGRWRFVPKCSVERLLFIMRCCSYLTTFLFELCTVVSRRFVFGLSWLWAGFRLSFGRLRNAFVHAFGVALVLFL